MSKIVSDKAYFRMIQACLGLDMRRGGMAGQALTSYFCVACEEPNTNSDTNTPLICPKCTKDLKPKIKEMWESGFFQVTDEDWDLLGEKLREFKNSQV